jgi:hypothetical protein
MVTVSFLARTGRQFPIAVHLEAKVEGLIFQRCKLLRPPKVLSEQLPQNSTFIDCTYSTSDAAQGANYSPTADAGEDEARNRHLRVLFGRNHARDMEGHFYAHEKRCQRKALPRGPSHWASRSFSALYDWSAVYGQSYERAFLVFIGLQVFFGFIYSWMVHGRWIWLGTFDWRMASLTLAQLARPFELFSLRGAPQQWPLESIPTEQLWMWAMVTGAHSVLSFIALALLLLALRWRFKRE